MNGSASRKQVALESSAYRLLKRFAEKRDLTAKEALGEAINLWSQLDDPGAILRADQVLQDARFELYRVWGVWDSNTVDKVESGAWIPQIGEGTLDITADLVDEVADGQSSDDEPMQRAYLPTESYSLLKNGADQKGLTLKDCATEAAIVWTTLLWWNEAEYALKMLEKVRDLVEGWTADVPMERSDGD